MHAAFTSMHAAFTAYGIGLGEVRLLLRQLLLHSPKLGAAAGTVRIPVGHGRPRSWSRRRWRGLRRPPRGGSAWAWASRSHGNERDIGVAATSAIESSITQHGCVSAVCLLRRVLCAMVRPTAPPGNQGPPSIMIMGIVPSHPGLLLLRSRPNSAYQWLPNEHQGVSLLADVTVVWLPL